MQQNSLDILLFCAVFLLVCHHADAASFRSLNKVTARTQDIEIPFDETVSLDTLRIVMRECVESPPEDPPEIVTFLEIDEARNNEIVRIFTGWMFASSPGLHALEHSVYDLWPLSCKNASSQ